jgi:ketosteroid isomerase-like protein
MKHVLGFLLAISTVFAYAQAQTSNSHVADEQVIRELNDTVLKAYNTGDINTVDRIESADFLLSGDFGEISKAQELEQMRNRMQQDHGSPIHLTVENVRLRFYGDAALLTEVEKYDDPTRYETTSLWVRQDSQWKIVHLHYSTLGNKVKSAQPRN